MNLREKLHILFEEPETSRVAYWFNIFIYSLIVISILSLMFTSVDAYRDKYASIFSLVTNIIMPIFIVEYIARVYASGRLSYIFTPYAIIDLLTVIPYILIGFGIESAFLRSLRLLRIFRLFRIKRYEMFIGKMKEIAFSKKEEFIVLLFFTLVIVVLLSFVIFELENKAQPDIFTNIFQTLWWAVATLTTVGYGDMYPITVGGQIITAMISILGIAFVAIPGGIFASEFINSFSKKEYVIDDTLCPKCLSDNIETSAKPTVVSDEGKSDFNKLHNCQECKFHWLS